MSYKKYLEWFIFIFVFLLIIILIGRGCVSCVNKINIKFEQHVEKVESKVTQIKNKTTLDKETSTNKTNTWSELLKSKPKEMQKKQEMLKASLNKMSKN